MKTTIHRANTRGFADHGWLKSSHTFSFAGYHNPERMRFGLLRVLNDDIVQPGKGFGTHPHDNMEIVSIPLSGSLAHKDSEGNEHIIKTGDVQIMSAGSGLYHSEYNASKNEPVNFLQIWVFPKLRNIKPRYDQKTFNFSERKKKLQTTVSPELNNGTLWINQDAYFSLGSFEAGTQNKYEIKRKGNGLYLFLIEGSIDVAEENLGKRDALGIEDIQSIEIKAVENSEILLIEVPMSP
ncbi:MAG: pirin family protein [Chlorobi bacterium]|nr:pirin family protein [Chlorobiota bacterium]MCI0715875.1 pirin family protein [Chlorobiota bacterium]